MESGAYTHTTNCSLFHMCTFGIHTIYSCIDGFFFNPTSGKCQYFPIKNEIKCAEIIQQMKDTDLLPPVETVKKYDYYHRRKSAISQCTQAGIYPDVLDCSLFHYCHQNKKHEILKCPTGLNFDPKIFMCSAPQLVNCQYEPPTITEDEIDTTESNTICRDYAPGTHLPVANKFDEYIICENNGKSIQMKCKPGFHYNALTTSCEMKPCAMDSTLCKNNGQCVGELTSKKGFKCICSIEYQGEYCEKRVELVETTKRQIETSTENLLRFADRLIDDNKPLTTNTNVNVDRPQNSISRVLHRLYNDYDQEQVDEIIKIIFVTILMLIILILLGSIIFGIIVCIRLISSPPTPIETVGTWKILPEESKV